MDAENGAMVDVLGILSQNRIPAAARSVDGKLVIDLADGFYKSDGIACLQAEEGRLFLKARYDEKTELKSLADLVACSHYWYEFSKDRFAGWAVPPVHWETLYRQFKLMG